MISQGEENPYVMGQFVIIENTGKVYSQYINKARQLNLDVDPELVSGRLIGQKQSNKSYRWWYGSAPRKGNLCIVVKTVDGYVGIERVKDSRQFVIGHKGLRLATSREYKSYVTYWWGSDFEELFKL